MKTIDSIDKINQLTKNDFIDIFGNVFEKTIWISEKVYELRPFLDFKELSIKFNVLFENQTKEAHLKILNFHPELAVEKIMTQESKVEQNKAKLNECSKEEFDEFKKLNNKYKEKFKFPFIIAVAGKNRSEILKNFKIRIKNNEYMEFEEAKKQVKKIANLRLKLIYNN
jgi:OHCU decarboxylase